VPARQRAKLVAALEGVDAVLLFGGRTVAPLLRRLRPEIHCKGTDYTSETVPERAIVRAYGGEVRISGDPKRHASTDLILGIRARHRGPGVGLGQKKKRSRVAPHRSIRRRLSPL
jgi:bifunctional ADP-heptose synthase (sugar kinase/adenylyltransferase)